MYPTPTWSFTYAIYIYIVCCTMYFCGDTVRMTEVVLRNWSATLLNETLTTSYVRKWNPDYGKSPSVPDKKKLIVVIFSDFTRRLWPVCVSCWLSCQWSQFSRRSAGRPSRSSETVCGRCLILNRLTRQCPCLCHGWCCTRGIHGTRATDWVT